MQKIIEAAAHAYQKKLSLEKDKERTLLWELADKFFGFDALGDLETYEEQEFGLVLRIKGTNLVLCFDEKRGAFVLCTGAFCSKILINSLETLGAALEDKVIKGSLSLSATEEPQDKKSKLPKEVFDLRIAGDYTIRDFLVECMCRLIIEDEGFSGKRPLGDSRWLYDIYDALVEAGYISKANSLGDMANMLVELIREEF